MAGLNAIVLAAGEGTRMRSQRPKPLHHLCGRPMVLHVIDAVSQLNVERVVVVVGHEAEWVVKSLTERSPEGLQIEFVEQHEQLGTGHAVSVALANFDVPDDDEDDVLILPGDAPLLRAEVLADLVTAHAAEGNALTVLSTRLANPTGYGRVVHGRDGAIARIVEELDATDEEREIDEVNTSIFAVKMALLGPALRRVDRTNSQAEYYLTDVASVLYNTGHVGRSHVTADSADVAGVNDRVQLSAAEAELRRRINERWMRRGVTMWDPASTYVDADVELAEDVSLLPGTIVKGACRVGAGAQIGPNALLVDVVVGARAQLGTVHATRAVVGEDAEVGSFTVLGAGTKVPAFARVEPHSTLSM
jgi:bifunctional UDP-N-acetylglucosamine pyrophosphorylase / glucosamine-1-phosphate N-acetyltransferase